MIRSDTTQEERILNTLLEAEGEWINGQFFLRTLLLSQYHRAIWNLEHRRDRYKYLGHIEHSEFKDDHGFLSYRLVTTEQKLQTTASDDGPMIEGMLFRMPKVPSTAYKQI